MQRKMKIGQGFVFSCVGIMLALGFATLGLADESSSAKPERKIPDWKKNFVPKTAEEMLEEKVCKPEPATLKDFKKARKANYPEDYAIEFKSQYGSLSNSTRTMPREKDGMMYFHYFTISVFVVKQGPDRVYMMHGLNNKHPEIEPVPDKGIPLDADPYAIIVFPPAKPGDSEIVRQYKLKERC